MRPSPSAVILRVPKPPLNLQRTLQKSPTMGGTALGDDIRKIRTSTSAVALTRTPLVGIRGQKSIDVLFKNQMAAEARDAQRNQRPSHCVKVRIFSNWGDPERISCSQVEILGEDKIALPVELVRSKPSVQGDLNILVDGVVVKDQSACWSSEWPLRSPCETLDLFFVLRIDEEIASIRIWPCSGNHSQNIREVEVIVDDMILFKGEIPKDFVDGIPLSGLNAHGKWIVGEPVVSSDSISDKIGVLPLRPINTLFIDLLDTYGCDKDFSLQAIRLYDKTGGFLDMRYVSLIEAVNCGKDVYHVSNIFIEDYSSMQDVWCGVLNQGSRITVTFDLDVQVTAVAIITANVIIGAGPRGLKNVRIFTNEHRRWVGRLKETWNFRDTQDCINVIYFVDSQEIRQKVTADLYDSRNHFDRRERSLLRIRKLHE